MILELSVDRSPTAVVSHKCPITEEDHELRASLCIDSDDEFETVFEMTEQRATKRARERVSDHRSIIRFSHEIEKGKKRREEKEASKNSGVRERKRRRRRKSDGQQDE